MQCYMAQALGVKAAMRARVRNRASNDDLLRLLVEDVMVEIGFLADERVGEKVRKRDNGIENGAEESDEEFPMRRVSGVPILRYGKELGEKFPVRTAEVKSTVFV